ncbi:ankyrin repeat-containing domain protein [Halteromyces radiatus]|uniref:ankyrin repeat-containing domain protein n=1 Tax=Halteromyces radiatus TaxID=101107 RepID=UPI002220099A|nr:ankyrin repeat-containing domain protein [Halteromyces radiatus]KAI8086034.1 ankyrin repeat-containing domain protein [Halteromyces radiatus]
MRNNNHHMTDPQLICRHRASVQGYTPLVKLLLDNGSRVNPPDQARNTPLHLACEEGHGDTAVILLENGADSDRLNTDGKTPVDLCSNELKSFLSQHLD